ncbi:hypothetical protein F2P79_002706, partial [Pimephales promelas]
KLAFSRNPPNDVNSLITTYFWDSYLGAGKAVGTTVFVSVTWTSPVWTAAVTCAVSSVWTASVSSARTTADTLCVSCAPGWPTPALAFWSPSSPNLHINQEKVLKEANWFRSPDVYIRPALSHHKQDNEEINPEVGLKEKPSPGLIQESHGGRLQETTTVLHKHQKLPDESRVRPSSQHRQRGRHVRHVHSNVCLTQSLVDHLFQISHSVVAFKLKEKQRHLLCSKT